MVDFSSPIGGGKFNKFVKDIINAEREPVRQIDRRKGKEGERLKLVQEFQARVRKIVDTFAGLDNLRKFKELKAEWPAKDLMDVSLDKDFAETGEYEIEIIQLAGRHSMISDGYESPDDEIGIGYFQYDLPNGDTKSVYIGPGNNTLRGMVRKINDQKALGVQASLINDGSDNERPWRVVVHARKSGLENDIEFPDFYFLDGDFRFYVDDERAAQNAIVNFNGFEIMAPSNKFELLPGVTLDLRQAKEDYEFTLSISEDPAKIAEKVQALVDALNGALKFVNEQNAIDAHTDTSKTLAGDTTLFTVESRIRNWIFEAFNVDEEYEDAYMRLSDIGIRFEKTGLLSFDKEKFKKVLVDNFDYVATLFAGQGNFIDKLKTMTDSFLSKDRGFLPAREKGIRDRIRTMDDDIARKEMGLARREQALKRQFSALEGLMNNIQGQQQFLNQALGSPGILPGM